MTHTIQQPTWVVCGCADRTFSVNFDYYSGYFYAEVKLWTTLHMRMLLPDHCVFVAYLVEGADPLEGVPHLLALVERRRTADAACLPG